MSYLIAAPNLLTTAAANAAGIGSSIWAANLAALAPTSTLTAVMNALFELWQDWNRSDVGPPVR